MLKNPWWKEIKGPFPEWEGPVGCKKDGGGCHRGQGRVGPMIIHRAVFRQDTDAILKAVEEGHKVGEVDGAGATPLHCAAWSGWAEGVELLLDLGAPIDASTNAGDRPYHLAATMKHDNIAALLKSKGASTERGLVIVQDHVPKVRDFFQKDCWKHHPQPYKDFMAWRQQEDAFEKEERERLIPSI